ncbi:hypothetical protein KCP75_00185 [Salmonella enterica subsp. enterica]|nr:hypothetical protein KCP75_00185 [Salmonella enterica subsp. enterica]
MKPDGIYDAPQPWRWKGARGAAIAPDALFLIHIFPQTANACRRTPQQVR